jgi:glycosyltransferase involved in cell wall biosynthesis
MKIAFCIRSDYKKRHGGDVVQMLKTKQKIEENSETIEIHIITDPAELNSSFDICHIFNFSTVGETEEFFVESKKSGCKIISSPIYWDYRVTAYSLFCSLGITRLTSFLLKLEVLILNFVNCFYPLFYHHSKDFRKKVLFFLDNSDLILPNSEEEMDLLMRFVDRTKSTYSYKVVLNASIESNEMMYLSKDEFLSKFNLPSEYILQVGRIEPIKNQLSLVKALFDCPNIPIVFLGRSIHKKYFRKVQKLSSLRGNVFFIDEVDHSEVLSFYKNAKLHILPSLRESPGLSSLEALAFGCKTLVAKFPFSPYETYFANKATSFNPLNLSSIRSAVLASSDSKDLSTNRQGGMSIYTWNEVGLDMIDIYTTL